MSMNGPGPRPSVIDQNLDKIYRLIDESKDYEANVPRYEIQIKRNGKNVTENKADEIKENKGYTPIIGTINVQHTALRDAHNPHPQDPRFSSYIIVVYHTIHFQLTNAFAIPGDPLVVMIKTSEAAGKNQARELGLETFTKAFNSGRCGEGHYSYAVVCYSDYEFKGALFDRNSKKIGTQSYKALAKSATV